MEPTLLGLVLDSSVLITAERAKLTTTEAVKNVRTSVGNVPIVICALSVAELGHGIYRADSPARSQQRRQSVATNNLRDFNRIPDLTIIQV